MKHFSLTAVAIGTALIFIGAGCSSNQAAPTVQENKAPQSAIVPATYNPDGITPKEITIKVGDSIEFRNSDLKAHQPASNPHPSHSLYPEFDAKTPIKPGETWVFKFEKAGTWKFHDHANPTNTKFQGTVIVQ